MKKLGVVITDGVGFRNFILSDFLVEAENCFDQVVVFSCLPESAYKDYNLKSNVIVLPVFEEKFKTWFFRKAKEIAHLKSHKKDNFGIQDSYRINKNKALNPRGLATTFIYFWTSIFYSEKWIQLYNSMQQKTFSKNKITLFYKNVLKEENCDLLFFTHQRPPYIAPLVYAAKQLKIKTTAFIFSWDNLASKGRMSANFDYYLVWSDLMRADLLHFYNAIKEQMVAVVGTPQFEPYVLDRYKTNRTDFYTNYDLDPNKKTICFSCGDISTSKNDELYIETLAKAIENKAIIANLIVRTSPAEDPIRFATIKENFPFVKWNFPKWNLSRANHQESWSQRIPIIEDIKDLRAILSFSDLNVNMLSTMSLDFMLFDKPVINVVFGNQSNNLYDDQRFLKYAHIKQVVDSKATKVAKNEKELIGYCNFYLQNPDADANERKKLTHLQVSKPLPYTGKRIAETLLQWS